MKNLILLALVLFISLNSDAAKKNKHKKQVKAVKKIEVVKTDIKSTDKANAMRLCSTPYPQPTWFLELPKGFKFPANFQQPAAYRIVSTIDTVFSSFLNGIQYDKSNTRIVLPLFMNNTIECKEFIVSRAITMDSALQAKYPKLMSFKAFAADNSLNMARIDCDENSVKMMITFDKKVYYINSVVFNKMKYYLCYAQDDPNFVKEKFER